MSGGAVSIRAIRNAALARVVTLAAALSATQAWPAPSAPDRRETIGFMQLLRVLADPSLESAARLPITASSVQSSRDPGSIRRSEPEAWFSESDSGNALRIDRVGGRSEWVLADIKGPGALTRLVLVSSAITVDAVLRIRLDGEPTPSIEWPLRGFSEEIAPGLSPFVVWNRLSVYDTAKGVMAEGPVDMGTIDCMLPMPFAASCVVTLDRRPDLYRVESVSFAQDARVERLAADPAKVSPGSEFDAMRTEVRARLRTSPSTVLATAPLAPRGRIDRLVEAAGARGGVIRRVVVGIDPFEAAAAVRDLWVECDFDGERTLRLPLGHFIGLGEQTGPTADGFRSVGARGTMEFGLPMPFARAARVSIVNRGAAALSCALELGKVEARTSSDPPQLLHGGYRMHRGLAIERPIEVELARIEGSGVLVGECYAQHAAVTNWWPTGDDRITIDGRVELAGPSYELVYGSSPGLPRLTRGLLVSVPMRANRIEASRWSASRLRVLDAVRFSESLVNTMELHPAATPGCDFSLSCSSLWYACAGASRGVGFDDPESMPPVATPRNIAPLSELFPPAKGEEWFEAERLPISFWSRAARWAPGDIGGTAPTKPWGSGIRIGLLASLNGVGDSIEFVIPARDAGSRRIFARFVRANDGARVAMFVNGARVPAEVDLGSPEIVPSELVDLGVHAPKDGSFVVRLSVAGLGGFARLRMHIMVDGFRTSPP